MLVSLLYIVIGGQILFPLPTTTSFRVVTSLWESLPLHLLNILDLQ